MMQPAIQIDGPTMRVQFDLFDIDAYQIFLKSKALPESTITFDWETDAYQIETASRFAQLLGEPAPAIEVDRLPIADHLFDYQRWIVEMALDARRFAVWCDTGLGKAAMGLEWARQVQHITFGRVLFVMPLSVIPQYLKEAWKFHGDGLPIAHLTTRTELRDWCEAGEPGFGITNYEKFIAPKGEPEITSEIRYLSGIVLDEASILKTGGGKIKWGVIKSCRGIPYKLSCTATPAPNEAMEYASRYASANRADRCATDTDGGSMMRTSYTYADIAWRYPDLPIIVSEAAGCTDWARRGVYRARVRALGMSPVEEAVAMGMLQDAFEQEIAA